jgi:hypothetical protein
MALFHAIVQPGAGVHRLVLHCGEFGKAPLRCRVAGELVRADPLRRLARVFEQAPEETLGRIGIAVLLHEDVQHLPVFIDGPPQIDLLTTDLQEHLVQVPRAAGSPFAPAQRGREAFIELPHPGTDALVGDHNAALEEEFLHIAEAEGKAAVEPDSYAMISAGKRCRWKWAERSGMEEEAECERPRNRLDLLCSG